MQAVHTLCYAPAVAAMRAGWQRGIPGLPLALSTWASAEEALCGRVTVDVDLLQVRER
jgi:hypothetical protein